MDTRITNRALVTIHVISRMAIIIVMGMIFTVIMSSIYGTISTTH
jgi:hypothetical protein